MLPRLRISCRAIFGLRSPVDLALSGFAWLYGRLKRSMLTLTTRLHIGHSQTALSTLCVIVRHVVSIEEVAKLSQLTISVSGALRETTSADVILVVWQEG
jgi:hypothetical protein